MRAETDSMIAKGVIGVGEGSVCASVQNIGAEVGLESALYRFQMQCTHIQPHWQVIFRGNKTVTTILGLSVTVILEDNQK